jgi:hypothetical protein
MEDLSKLIDYALLLKTGNREFALFYNDGDYPTWVAEAGNPCTAVMLGEASGECKGIGSTPEQAVLALIDNIRDEQAKPKKQTYAEYCEQERLKNNLNR